MSSLLLSLRSRSVSVRAMWMATKPSSPSWRNERLSDAALAQLLELKPSLPETESLPTMEESLPKDEIDEALIPLHDPAEPRKFPFQVSKGFFPLLSLPSLSHLSSC
jgi:hypothetical protein